MHNTHNTGDPKQLEAKKVGFLILQLCERSLPCLWDVNKCNCMFFLLWKAQLSCAHHSVSQDVEWMAKTDNNVFALMWTWSKMSCYLSFLTLGPCRHVTKLAGLCSVSGWQRSWCCLLSQVAAESHTQAPTPPYHWYWPFAGHRLQNSSQLGNLTSPDSCQLEPWSLDISDELLTLVWSC